MMKPADRPDPWADAIRAAELLALDPAMCGGVRLISPAGEARRVWLDQLAHLSAMRTVKIPAGVGDAELLGGLDLQATLANGRATFQTGALERADGGVAIIAMAERLPQATAASIALSMDEGVIRIERDGLSQCRPITFGVVALDEGEGAEEPLPAVLAERLGLTVRLPAQPGLATPDPSDLLTARDRLPSIQLSDAQDEALAATAVALGIGSLRPLQFARRTARAHAALAGRDHVADDDIAFAARLTLAPRATRWPSAEPSEPEAEPPPPQEEQAQPQTDAVTQEPQRLEDIVLEAAKAALPTDLLAALVMASTKRRPLAVAGQTGESTVSKLRGRPLASRKGDPRRRARIDLLATLRHAAPWQVLRQRERPTSGARVIVEAGDLHVRRFKEQRGSTTIFVVDASGSTARDRLAEAKGAIELLLADCYVRRDQVALVAFRGQGADILLPPTRSLHRARKCLAALPGGGGTPLAAGLEAAGRVAADERRKGRTPTLVIISDGRANVGRDGQGGRERAQADAEQTACWLAAEGVKSIMIDNAPRPEPKARNLADKMQAAYVPLPVARADAVAAIVRAHHASQGTGP